MCTFPSELTKFYGLVANELLADARGAQTYMGHDKDKNKISIKIVVKGNDYDRAISILQNEIEAHREISLLGEYLRHSSGETANYVWLASRWVAGESSSAFAEKLGSKGSHDATRELLKLFDAMAFALEEIHHAGYVHGDLQGRHFIVQEAAARVRIIDFGSARKIGVYSDLPEGGLIHFTAPEVALRSLENPKGPPALSELSEVFSLGSVFSFLLTGQSLLDTADGTKEHEVLLRDIIAGRFRSVEPRPGFKADAIRSLINLMLSHDPKSRPSLTAVRMELGQRLSEFVP